ncbi:hypothetical protein G6706_03240 [Polynucleobacter paneuropaeus]|nr:hypothetical protein [Polynucleobacter paneuropaeus]MBT8554456.1 hypothetical protein [Polynucleobacter paneuropaeus]MBT8559733.1 hypothetical protein [Polynucleobacter paneuropaeus]QWD34629.1 hypothetical protein G6676_05195 [Polynucleobacter paneuropaeus]
MKILAYILSLSLLLVTLEASAQAVNPMPVVNDNWRFSGTISGWTPASWITTSAGKYSANSDSSINQNLSSAGAAGMFTLEAHKGNWGLMGDLVYWQFSGSGGTTYYTRRPGDGSLYGGYNAQQTQTMLTVAGTYTALNTPTFYLDGLLGARYISATTTLTSNFIVSSVGGRTASATNYPSYTNQTTDPVIGFKGRARIMDSAWFIPYYADGGKGPGSNNSTWQALLGVGNAFSWGDITLAYRAMGFHLKATNGNTNYTNAGPQLSATINF